MSWRKDQLLDAEHIEHNIRMREYFHDCPDCQRERQFVRIEKSDFDKFTKALLAAPTPPKTFVTMEGALDWLVRYRAWFDGERREAVPSVGPAKT